MAGVFLSYASEDRERVALLAESLRAEGFDIWWDREIPIAFTYEDYIREQLDSAGAVVVVWSPESVASRYVRWEVRRAERRGVLVPVMIEEADLPPEYFLIQAADLTRWEGDRSDREWRRLVAALVRLVGEPAPVAPSVPEAPVEAPAPEAAQPPVAPVAPVPVAAEEETPAAEPPPAEPEVLEVGVAGPELEEAMPTAGLVEAGETEGAPPAEEVSLGSPAATEGEAAMPVEAEPAVVPEEVEEGAALVAEAEIAESLRTWEPAVEETAVVPEGEEEAAAGVPAAGEPRRAVPWYRRPLVLAGIGVLLLAAIVVPIVVVLSGGGEEVTTTVAVSTTEAVSTTGAIVAPTSTAVPTTTVATSDVPDMTWARLPYSDALVPPAGWGVAWGSGRVAVGSDGSGGDEDAAVYLAADGVTWERVPHDEAVFGGPGDQQMRAVTVGGPGLVAVGQDGYSGAVWTSTDGLIWERVADEAGAFGDVSAPREVWGVTAGGPGLVVVGVDEYLDGAAAVWTSADGLAWERVPHDEAVFGGDGWQPMQAVALGGPGLVAVGWEESPDAADAAVWTSTDGLTWTRLADDDGALGGPGRQEMLAVAAGGPGLVAAGWEDSGGGEDAAVWASVDGLTWERVAHDEVVFGGSEKQTALGLAEVEGLGLVAWGEDSADPYGKGIWVSPPAGLDWARVPQDRAVFGGPGYQSMLAVAAGGPGLVGVGLDDPDGDKDAAVWVSTNGLTWERVPHDEEAFGGTGDQSMWAVAAGGPGLVAVGEDYPGGEFTGSAAVWVSTNGLTWERVPHDEEVFGGPNNQGMLAVVAGGPGLVAVGWDDEYGGAAVWTSVDGTRWEQTSPNVAAFAGCSMQAVATYGSSVVAAGVCTPSEDWTEWAAAIWVSTDGLTWERVPHDEELFGDSTGITALAVWRGDLVAVGLCGLEGEDSDVVVWTSDDGSRWTRMLEDEKLGGSGDQRIDDLLVGVPGLVAVGTELWVSSDGATWASGDTEAAGRFFGLATLGWRLVAVGTDGTDSAVWTSPPPG